MKAFPSRALPFAVAGLVWLGLMSACGTAVTVDSLARPYTTAVSYELINRNPEPTQGSLPYKEVADYVHTALASRGMHEAPPGVKPDLVVHINFGISEPHIRQEKRLVPVERGYVRPSSRPPSGTVIDEDPLRTPLTPPPPPRSESMKTITVTSTVYEKYLYLTALEFENPKAGQPPREIWTVSVTSEGPSQHLRESLPALAAAARDHIGQDTRGLKNLRIKDKGLDVAPVK